MSSKFISLSNLDRVFDISPEDLVEISQLLEGKYISKACSIDKLMEDVNNKILILQEEINNLLKDNSYLHPLLPLILSKRVSSYDAVVRNWKQGEDSIPTNECLFRQYRITEDRIQRTSKPLPKVKLYSLVSNS